MHGSVQRHRRTRTNPLRHSSRFILIIQKSSGHTWDFMKKLSQLPVCTRDIDRYSPLNKCTLQVPFL